MHVRTDKLPDIRARLPTGGDLNRLNEKYKCNARRNTVPIMDLVKYHGPTSPEHLRRLIEQHHTTHCTLCGCRSAGTVEQFAGRLYNAQFNEPDAQRRFSWDECYRFHYTLFCVAPLRGLAMERAVQHAVAAVLTNKNNADIIPTTLMNDGVNQRHTWHIREATQHEDFNCAVDLVIERTDQTGQWHTVIGLQVKPESVLKRKQVMVQNRQKQETFGAPVLFVVYDSRGEWTPTAAKVVEEAERLQRSTLSHSR